MQQSSNPSSNSYDAFYSDYDFEPPQQQQQVQIQHQQLQLNNNNNNSHNSMTNFFDQYDDVEDFDDLMNIAGGSSNTNNQNNNNINANNNNSLTTTTTAVDVGDLHPSLLAPFSVHGGDDEDADDDDDFELLQLDPEDIATTAQSMLHASTLIRLQEQQQEQGNNNNNNMSRSFSSDSEEGTMGGQDANGRGFFPLQEDDDGGNNYYHRSNSSGSFSMSGIVRRRRRPENAKRIAWAVDTELPVFSDDSATTSHQEKQNKNESRHHHNHHHHHHNHHSTHNSFDFGVKEIIHTVRSSYWARPGIPWDDYLEMLKEFQRQQQQQHHLLQNQSGMKFLSPSETLTLEQIQNQQEKLKMLNNNANNNNSNINMTGNNNSNNNIRSTNWLSQMMNQRQNNNNSSNNASVSNQNQNINNNNDNNNDASAAASLVNGHHHAIKFTQLSNLFSQQTQQQHQATPAISGKDLVSSSTVPPIHPMSDKFLFLRDCCVGLALQQACASANFFSTNNTNNGINNSQNINNQNPNSNAISSSPLMISKVLTFQNNFFENCVCSGKSNNNKNGNLSDEKKAKESTNWNDFLGIAAQQNDDEKTEDSAERDNNSMLPQFFTSSFTVASNSKKSNCNNVPVDDFAKNRKAPPAKFICKLPTSSAMSSSNSTTAETIAPIAKNTNSSKVVLFGEGQVRALPSDYTIVRFATTTAGTTNIHRNNNQNISTSVVKK